jgi:hypothetical protein
MHSPFAASTGAAMLLRPSMSSSGAMAHPRALAWTISCQHRHGGQRVLRQTFQALSAHTSHEDWRMSQGNLALRACVQSHLLPGRTPISSADLSNTVCKTVTPFLSTPDRTSFRSGRNARTLQSRTLSAEQPIHSANAEQTPQPGRWREFVPPASRLASMAAVAGRLLRRVVSTGALASK